MRAAVAQTDCFLGDIGRNLESHERFIRQAAGKKAEVVLFPELSLSGYLLEDRVREIAIPADTLAGMFGKMRLPAITIGVGFPERTSSAIHNAYALIRCTARGVKIIAIQRKINLPTYGMFDESRHFRAGDTLAAHRLSSRVTTAVLLCEDSWHPALPVALASSPKGAPHLLIVPAASPSRGYRRKRPSNIEGWEHIAEHFSRVYGVAVLMPQRVGVEDSLIFAGGSLAVDHNGTMSRAPLFKEHLLVVEIDTAAISRAHAKTAVLSPIDRDIARTTLG